MRVGAILCVKTTHMRGRAKGWAKRCYITRLSNTPDNRYHLVTTAVIMCGMVAHAAAAATAVSFACSFAAGQRFAQRWTPTGSLHT